MIRIPLYLEVAQWALLFGLGALVIVLYRQLGRLLSSAPDSPAPGPQVGSRAAPIRYLRAADGTAGRLAVGDGTPALVAFVDPTCPACEQLVTSLTALHEAAELPGIQILLLISDPPGYLGISAAFAGTSLEVGRPVSTAEVAGYRATGTPLLVAVDGGGVVRAAGVVSEQAAVRGYAAAVAAESEAVR